MTSSFEDAKLCYERPGLARAWDAVVGGVCGAHHRKTGFLDDFEQLVMGRGPSGEPSLLERARSRRAPREES